jgi:hypothetical protein
MTCRLCKKEQKLCDSHIIAELFHKELYDPIHRAVKLQKNGQQRFIQKGERDLLLCSECERHIANNIETPFANSWRKILPSSCDTPTLELSGLDYKSTKLMLLSNLWRAHCSKKEVWKSVELGPYADKIATMIKQLDPRDEMAFPIWGQVIVDEEDNIRKDIIYPFWRSRPIYQLKHHSIYVSIYGGVEWFIVISDSKDLNIQKCCLSQSGHMLLLKKIFLESSSYKKSWKK